ncbi:AraC family transcriptional regulator [Pseudonocardiaceae bacterium YIM PH 21723]|nr:AraC family transcriptional regulator [Pseudonocardiaceae bacterium YIM PH 21723]
MGWDFESHDLGEIEQFIAEQYATIRLKSESPDRNHFSAVRESWGPISIDLVDYGFELQFSIEPMGRLALLGVESGEYVRIESGDAVDGHGVGDVFLLSQPDQPTSGLVQGRFNVTMLDPVLLSAMTDCGAEPVRLTSHRPVTPALGTQLLTTVAFLRDNVLTEPLVRDAPLVVSSAAQLLAATVLQAFPSTAVLSPTIEDRHDACPPMLRRAMAYIDDHADRPITVAKIAAAVPITVRALQYAFQKYRGTTPMGYLREVRLHHAHRDLAAADPETGVTVTDIAARWGFFHLGRFATYYRGVYGRAPRRTLMGGAR